MAARHTPCPSCGAPVDGDQRYCLACGQPCSDESARLLALVAAATPAPTAPSPAGPESTTAPTAVAPVPVPVRRDRRALTSAAFAVAGIALLVMTGWGTSTAETLASALPPGLSVNYPAPAAPAVAAIQAAAPTDTTTTDTTADVTPVDDTAVSDTAATDTGSTDTSVSDTSGSDTSSSDTSGSDTTTTDTTTTDTTTTDTSTDEETPPPVQHVFLIVLSTQDVAADAQTPADAPYLANTLAKQGTILTGYRGIAAGSLPNSIALISGQGPTPETATNCPTYTDVAPATIGSDGQEIGTGCVHSVQTGTIGDQLVSNGQTWRAYVEAPAGAACRHPTVGQADPNQLATPTDAAVTWRDPFVYFHTAIDSPDCAKLLVGLDALDADLASGTKAPAFSYIVPDTCHDGSAAPCAPGAPAGAAAADTWLSTLVPKILASKAYADDGLLVITSDATAVNGADDPACCRPKTYPNLQGAGEGGRVGALLVSPYVAKGKVVDTSYSHFTLLRSIEDIFSLPPLGYADLKDVGSLVPDVIERTKAGS